MIVADPELVKVVYTSNPDDLGPIQPNLSRLLGSGSVFGLGGAEHRRRRKLLAQSFHASNMKNYEAIVEEETLRDMAGWPEGKIQNPRSDEADHAQRDSACGFRGRRQLTSSNCGE